jgi:DNA-binding SARP family transcriptional activator/TolB-like protein
MMPIRLRTFGSVYLTRDGKTLSGAAGQRRLLAILTVVAAVGDQGISRDKLLALLWSEGDPDKSRHALTQSLYHIKKALGGERIFAAGADLRLDADSMSSDVGDFQRAVQEQRFDDAAALYGGPFMDGFYLNGGAEFDFWVSAERSRLARQHGDALRILAERANAAGDASSERRWLERLVDHDPVDAKAVSRLLACLVATGDRAEALQRARVYETRMRDELDLPPDDIVVEVLANLRRSNPSAYGVPAVRGGSAATENETQRIVDADTSSPRGDPALGARLANFAAEASPSPSPSRSEKRTRRFSWFRRYWIAAVAAAGSVAVVVRAAASHLANDRAVTQGSTIAIAPFHMNFSDPSTADLRDGLVDLLAVRLADADAKSPTQPTRVSQSWPKTSSRDALSVEEASRVARGLDAAEVLIGAVDRAPSGIVITASLVDALHERVKATASAQGSPDSLNVLADRIVGDLILQESGERGPHASAPVTSPLALRAYIAGRGAYRRADFYGAVRAFNQAITIDPNFALAALSLAVSADRANAAEQHDRGLAMAWARRDDLSPTDRAFLIAFAGPRYPQPSSARETVAAWENVVQIAPERADGWYELGESFYYDGELLGLKNAAERAEDAFRHALRLNRSFAPARRMLTLVLARLGDTTELRRLIASSSDADPSDALRVFVRWRAAQALHDARELARVRGQFDDAPNSALRAIAMTSQFDGVSVDDGDRALSILRRRRLSDAEALDVELARHSRALNSDDFTTALAITASVGAAQPATHPQLRLRVLDALYSSGDRPAASAAVDALQQGVDADRPSTSADSAVRLADVCVLGQWRLAMHDTTAARRAERALRAAGAARTPPRFSVPVGSNPSTCGELLDVSLAIAERGGGARDRLAHLDSLMLSGPSVGDAMRYTNLVIARHYQSIGDPTHALAALHRRSFMRGWPRYRATGLRLQIEAATQVGDTALARSARARLVGTTRRMKIAEGPDNFVHRLRSFSRSLVH